MVLSELKVKSIIEANTDPSLSLSLSLVGNCGNSQWPMVNSKVF